ncbi:MAG: hypothetical protein DYH17_05675 [Xanthomonadales bacterium PRO6]|nr:hypothetical protein [Xanthomonadales bacterium PRO6]
MLTAAGHRVGFIEPGGCGFDPRDHVPVLQRPHESARGDATLRMRTRLALGMDRHLPRHAARHERTGK